MGAQVFDLVHYNLSGYALPPLITGLLVMALGAAVLARERSSFVSFSFWILTWVGATWLLSYVGIYCAKSPATALWWARLENMAVAFLPSLTFIFTLTIIGRFRDLWAQACAALFVSALFCLTVPLTDWFVAGVYRYAWGHYARYGPLTFLFLPFFCLMMASSLHLLREACRHADSPIQRRRLNAFLTAIGIACLASIDYLPAYGVPVYPAGYLPVFGFLVLSARAIWRYHLVDLTPAFVANQIVRTMGDPLVALDRDGIIRLVNPSACRLLEQAEETLLGKPIWTVAPDFLSQGKVERALKTEVVQRCRGSHTTRAGETIPLDISVTAVPDRHGHGAGVICIARELAEGESEGAQPAAQPA